MNFALKLSLKIFLTGSIILTIAMIIVYNNSYKNALNNEVEHSKIMVKEISVSLNQNLLEKIKTTKAIAVAPSMKKALNESNTHYSSLSNQLRSDEIKSQNEKWIAIKDHNDSFIRKFTDNSVSQYFKNLQNNLKGEYGEIFLTNKYGALVASTAKLTTFAHNNKYWWKGSYDDGSVFFDDRGYDESVGGYVLGIVIPVKEGNEIIGILKANLNILGSISKIISNTQSTHVGELKLIRSGGLIIFEKGIEPLSTRISSGISEKIKFDKESSFVFEEQDNEWIIGLAEIELSSNIEGFHFGGSFESIDHKKGNTGESWYLISYRPKKIIKNNIQSDLDILLIVGSLLLVFLALTALIIGNQTANPLKKLMRHANKIAKGDFDSKIFVKRKDEIGLLAAAFNKMTKNLKLTTTSIDKLNVEIIERKKIEAILKQERKLVQQYLDVSGAMLIALNKEQKVTLINPKGCEILGYSEEEILGENWFEKFLLSENSDEIKSVFDQIISGHNEAVEYYENFIIRKDGSKRIIAWHNSVLHDSRGEIVGLFSSGEDITDRKRSELELSESEEKFRVLYNNSPDMYISVSPDDAGILQCNKTLLNKTGYSREEVIGFPIFKMYHDDCMDEVKKAFQQFVETGKVQDKELILKRKDGSRIDVSLNANAVLNDEGKIMYSISSWRDITERKHAEEKLKESEERFRAIFEQAAVGVVQADLSTGAFVRVNQKYLDIVGYTEEELFKFSFKDITHPDDLEIDLENMRSLQMGKISNFDMDKRYIKKDGSIVWVKITASPMSQQIDSSNYLIVVVEDITERKQAEIEIKKLSAAVEQSANTIVISDIEGNIEYTNPIFTELTGYTAEEALGQNPRILNAGTLPKEYYAEMWKTISSGEIWEGEFHNKTKNGDLFWEHVIITPLKNDDGVITNYLAIKENITDKKKAELNLKKSEEQLRELNATKDKFFSIIAHDLRTPFNSILGFSELILENSKRNDFSDMLKMSTVLNNTVNKSFDLLNNLLEWSRVQTGRIEFKPDDCHLSPLIKEVTDLFSLAVKKKNIDIVFDMPEIILKADSNMLHTVIRNLLSNSIKFSHKGGTIKISAVENINEVVISVKDNGVGINKDSLGKIFQLAENITTLGTDNEKGTGLGLILCKEFIENHGGKFSVESEEGKGSRFYFTIPNKNLKVNSKN